MLNLLPRDEKYFDRFNDMAARIHESARMLDRFFARESPDGIRIENGRVPAVGTRRAKSL